jgi:hypothetical protein
VWRGADVIDVMCVAGSGSVLLYMWCGERMYNACGGERICKTACVWRGAAVIDVMCVAGSGNVLL